MQTYFLVIMILLFRVIIMPLCITITCVPFWVHDLRVGILVIYILLHTYLLANILLLYIILWECIPLYLIVFMSILLRVGILVIPIYFIACITSFHGFYSSYFLRVGIICYYNLIIILMSLMRTYFLVIMILLFRVINIPLGITITCVDFWVHDLRVGILVIYILLHTYLLAIILLFYIILWECIPLYRIVFTSLCLRVGILVIPIYIMACISSFYGLYSSYFKGGYSRYISLVAHIHTC